MCVCVCVRASVCISLKVVTDLCTYACVCVSLSLWYYMMQRTVIFCTTQFEYLKNREDCIHDFTGGPLLE
jgi:hypothetical protein